MAELSGLEVLALAKEIESSLRGTYVKNVYSLGSGQVLRFGKPGSEDVWVVASPRHGVWVSRSVSERAETTPFTTALRQALGRSRFASARQLNRDRIFDLAFGEGEDARHLVLELMPPGNILVNGPDGKVLLALNEVNARSRRVSRGLPYSFPPQRRKSAFDATPADVAEAVSREKTAGGAIGKGFTLPRKYVAEVLSRLGLDETAPASALEGREGEVTRVLKGIEDEGASSRLFFVCETPKGEEVYAVPPRGLEVKQSSSSLSELCDKLFLGEVANPPDREPSEAESKRRELEATVARLRTEEAALRAESAKLRDRAADAIAAPTQAEALLVMSAAGVKPRSQPASKEAVSSALFDRAKELERKADESREAADDLARKARRGREKPIGGAKELRRGAKEWFEKFRWFRTSGGKLAIGGRDAQTNSLLVRRHLDSNDTVYHADLFGSPFFILKDGRAQTDDEVSEVAQATVAFSSAWKTGLGAADAYWVEREQVSTAAPSGEFLPKGGFLILGKKNFVPRVLVELAVGVSTDGRVVSGPERAIAAAAVAYVVIRPHREKGSETAKKVGADLGGMVGEGSRVRIPVDDVLRMLPTGGGKVVRRHSASETRRPPGNA